MENKKINILKIFATVIFAALAFGGLAFVLLKGDIQNHIISIAAVAVSFVFSLLFLRISAKKILLTLALAANAVAMALAIFVPTTFNGLLEVCLLLGGELCFVVYTLCITKGAGLRIISLALRVGLCMLAYFVLPNYIAITTKEMLMIMLMLNQLTTIAILAFNFKKEWLTLLGMLLLLCSTAFAWLTSGGVDLFGITNFIEFLYSQDWAFIFKVPALFAIALSSVWEKKKQN